MIRATLCIDDAVGESRRALLDPFGKPFRLEVERWSERGRRAKLDEIWWGRVKARMPGNRGWFVDLGLERDGIIESSKAQAITEGAMLAVRVKSEAWAEKSPVLSLADMSPSAPRPDGPQLHQGPAEDAFLRGVEVVATLRDQAARTPIDDAIAEAGQQVIGIEGGGDIAIQASRAMTVVDVDAGERVGAQDVDAFAFDLNIAAAGEAARQISLRGIGGLLAVDFVGMKQGKHQRAVAEAFRKSLAGWLGRASEVLELSQLGVCEAAIARRARPVRDALAIPVHEREALDAIREIESAGWAARGGKIRARVSREAANWLEADHIGWGDALADRIGARWTLEPQDRPPGRADVWSMG